MITLYGHTTPNVYKITIALEELGLPYRYEQVDIFAGEGQKPEFLKISPAGKVPAIVDHDTGAAVYESNAILLYLAEKAGKLLPNAEARTRLMELMFLQASLQGPMFGQRAHFSMFAPEIVPYGIKRYDEQGRIIDGLVARLLEGKSFFMGDDFTIVDIAFFGWYLPAKRTGYFDEIPQTVKDWFDRLSARPGAARGIEKLPANPLPPRRAA